MLKVKSLLGATLSICMATMGWQLSGKTEQKTASSNLYSEEFLTELSNIMNSSLPMMLEEGVRWDSSYAGPGKILNYNYTIVDYHASQMDGMVFANRIRHDLTNTICTTPETQIFPDNGVLLNFNYYGRGRSLITRVKISPDDCR
jgi:hypothetical protein